MEKIAVVTGATSGIGAAYARLLAEEGWNLILTGRREDKIKLVAKALDKIGIHADVVITDFNNKESFKKFISYIKDIRVGFLVNCVGF